ncbi:MAG: DUF4116 domain-containing protein [Lachnospiraceae bacterium]|nr:DUF4116 domain-containing protein [Lachnospiraceae bacterium]
MFLLRSNIRNIGVGTKLYEDEEATAIYEKYKSYFELDDKYEWMKIYIVKKDPSPELVAKIKTYDEKITEENRQAQEYIDTIAKDVFDNLDDRSKEYIFAHPDSTEHHFGMGMGIRNKYDLWGEQPEFLKGMHPDDLSSMIMDRVSSYVIPAYDFYSEYHRSLYGDFRFTHLRRLYYAVHGYYPDKIIEKYEKEPNIESASKRAFEEVKCDVIDKARFETMCSEYGISDNNQDALISYVDQYNEKNWDLIPYDIGLLGSRMLEDDIRQSYLRLLREVLEQHPRHADDLPAFMFNQKDAVMVMVGRWGSALKRVKKFNADDEVIRKALSSNGEAIQYVKKELRDRTDYIKLALSDEYNNALKMRCMIKYRDDEKMVRIALKANGCNIQYASDRLKDDLETAKYAVTHQKNWYPGSTVCNLSTRLRDTEEIALLDISKGHACIDSYSRRLRDSDVIAQALLKSKHKWKIYQMSKRIRSIYDKD